MDRTAKTISRRTTRRTQHRVAAGRPVTEGTRCRGARDALGEMFCDEDFADLFPAGLVGPCLRRFWPGIGPEAVGRVNCRTESFGHTARNPSSVCDCGALLTAGDTRPV